MREQPTGWDRQGYGGSGTLCQGGIRRVGASEEVGIRHAKGMHTPGIHRAEERRIDAALSILQTHTCITHREPDRGGGTSLFRGGSFLVKNALRVTQYSKARCRPRSMRVADRYPAVLRNDHGRSHASRDTFARDTTDHRYIPPRTAVKIALHNERADATRVTRRPCRVEHPGAEVGNVSHEPSRREATSYDYVAASMPIKTGPLL
jgi:hypothetical protein